MNTVTLTLNGEQTTATVEPRTHLADWLREDCRLTGTHLGCEHGVCGACTVLIDGQPARACITFTAACDGADVRTIEGFEDDALMADLRAAFTREHALQCGFCTPGMLIAARDVALRARDADDHAVRVGMSGNLCRCTGYLGIARAVTSVIEARRGPAAVAANAPVANPPARPWQGFTPAADESSGLAPAVAARASPTPVAGDLGPRDGWHRIEERFVALQSIDQVWAAFADVAELSKCLPGAEIDEARADTAKGRIHVRFGPMRAAFNGATSLERDDALREGRLRGGGQDTLTGSRARADITYRLTADTDPRRTLVSIVLDYNLQGPLAQFSRSGIVRDFTGRLVAQFADNLNARLQGNAPAGGASGRAAEFDAGGMFWQVLWSRIRRLFGGR